MVLANAKMFQEYDPKQRRGTLLVQGIESKVTALASSSKSLAITQENGIVQVWNVSKMRLSTAFWAEHTSSLSSVQFDDRSNLLLGRSNGSLEVYDLKDKNRRTQVLKHSAGRVTNIRVRGSYMATSDEDRCVALYYYNDTDSTYAYLGKYRSHRDDITGLCFVSDRELVSVSRDGFKVTYDLDKTSIRDGVVLKGPRVRCERTGT